MQIRKSLKRCIFYYSLVYLLPVMLGAALFLADWYEDWDIEWKAAIGKDHAIIDNIAQVISLELNRSIQTAQTLAMNEHTLAALRSEPDARHHLGDRLLDLLSVNSEYDQVRLVNASGREVLRANQLPRPTLVPAAELQDKSNRYYIQEAAKLPPGRVYISNFDLNFERGKVETPSKLMLRITVPVHDDGELRGFVVLNYYGERILDIAKQLTKNAQGRLLLLDHEGRLLQSSHPIDSARLSEITGQLLNDARPADNQSLYSIRLSQQYQKLKGTTATDVDFSDKAALYLVSSPDNEIYQQSHADSPLRYMGSLFLPLMIVLALIVVARYWRGSTNILEDNERYLNTITESLKEGLLITTATGDIIDFNQAACRMFDYSAKEFAHLNIHDLLPVNLRERHRALMREVVTTNEESYSRITISVAVATRTATELYVDIDINAQYLDGQIKRFICLLNNATQTHNMIRQLRESAQVDMLTGVYNRRYFYERAHDTLAHSKRSRHAVSLLMLDIDYFKLINDRYGHAAGDFVLQELARHLKGAIREIDLVGRYGGEEFLVMLPDSDLDNSLQVARRILDNVRQTPVEYEGQHIDVCFSGGIAQWQGESETLDQFVCRADDAMYQAKQQGRCQIITERESAT